MGVTLSADEVRELRREIEEAFARNADRQSAFDQGGAGEIACALARVVGHLESLFRLREREAAG